MKKVFAVFSMQDWSSRKADWQRYLIGIFTSREKAEEIRREVNGDVYEVELDKIADILVYHE